MCTNAKIRSNHSLNILWIKIAVVNLQMLNENLMAGKLEALGLDARAISVFENSTPEYMSNYSGVVMYFGTNNRFLIQIHKNEC